MIPSIAVLFNDVISQGREWYNDDTLLVDMAGNITGKIVAINALAVLKSINV